METRGSFVQAPRQTEPLALNAMIAIIPVRLTKQCQHLWSPYARKAACHKTG